MNAFEIKNKETGEKDNWVLDKIIIDGRVKYLIADSKKNLRIITQQELIEQFNFERVL